MTLRVLIFAADPLARAGLAALLSEQAGCEVVGQLGEGADVAGDAMLYQADVVLCDLGWSAEDLDPPSHWFADLAEAGKAVVVLLPSATHAAESWNAGARGLLLRDIAVDALLAALQAAAAGLQVLEPSLAAEVQPIGRPIDDLPEELTSREAEVLQLVADGLTNRAIAQRLGISEHTVKFHVNAILGKLDAQSRTEAVVRATRLGLILF